MTRTQTSNSPEASGGELPSRWPHRLAVVLLCATLMLICVGGLVTTLGAGMAFADWPTSDGANMFLYPWLQAAGDKFVEHGHRLFGALVGLITIAVTVSLWKWDKRRWMGWLGIAALALVIFQGVLGGMRVRASDVQLAKIHGCVAPLFFALVVAIVVFTSRWWHQRAAVGNAAGGRLQRLAVFTAGLAYLQLVIGAQIRHVPAQSTGDALRIAIVFHLLVAFALLVHSILLFTGTSRKLSGDRSLTRPAKLLLLLILVQLVLGSGTWILKYAWPAEFFHQFQFAAAWTNTSGGVAQSLVVTSHVALGSLILGSALFLAIRLLRGLQRPSMAALGQVNPLGVAV